MNKNLKKILSFCLEKEDSYSIKSDNDNFKIKNQL